MQPQLTTKEGNIIPLTDETYEAIMHLVRDRSDYDLPASSIDDLEKEFAELFLDAASTDDLLDEHSMEKLREHRKLERSN